MNTPQLAPARPWIGGGSIAAAIGISPLATPVEVYLEMTGQALQHSEEKLKFFRRRTRVEPYVVAMLEEEHGMVIKARNVRYEDPEFPFLRAEIDAEQERPDGRIRNIEIKSVHPYAAKPWGTAGDDQGVPLYVLAQVTFGMMVTRRFEAVTVGQIGFDDGRLYEVEYRAELGAMLRAKAIEFWNNHVVPRNPPAPRTVEDALLLFPRSQVRPILSTPAVEDHLREMARIDNEVKNLEAAKEAHSVVVRDFMKDADTLLKQGTGIIATYRSNKQGSKTDLGALTTSYEAELLHRGIGMLDWIKAEREKVTTYPVPVRPLRNLLK